MTRIENEVQYQWAVAKVEKLLSLVNDHTLPDDPNHIELELLSNLLTDYSDEHFTLGLPTLVDSIRLRMYEMELTQKALSDLLGISPKRINEIITAGKSRLITLHAI